MRPDAVIFDMDGVLFDTERLYVDAWRQAAAQMNLRDMEPTIQGCIGLSAADTRRWFATHHPADFPFEEFIATERRCFFDTLDRDGLPIKPGAPELLRWLREQGVPVALATSSRATSAGRHLAAAGWQEGVFDAIVTGDMVENGKPAPDIYRLACRTLGVSPAASLAVEDSYNGLRAAAAAGMRPVMVPDLLPPTDEIAPLLYRCFDSLVDMHRWLRDEMAKEAAVTLEAMDWAAFEALYHTAMTDDFPAAERKPLALLRRLWREGICSAWALLDDGTRRAYAVLEQPPTGDACLLDYLAVDASVRGRGFGGEMLRRLTAAHPQGVILLEIERVERAADAAQLAERTRRRRFYLQNGVYPTGVFTRADGGVEYEILASAPLSPAAAVTAMEGIYATLFAPGETAVWTE